MLWNNVRNNVRAVRPFSIFMHVYTCVYIYIYMYIMQKSLWNAKPFPSQLDTETTHTLPMSAVVHERRPIGKLWLNYNEFHVGKANPVVVEHASEGIPVESDWSRSGTAWEESDWEKWVGEDWVANRMEIILVLRMLRELQDGKKC